ncbi:MAG: hypothetical protein PHF17_00880 [Arcobacteraceae bacterium]|nr:hypothetical protein [Arcobacteraceae bacterium]
MVKILGNKIQGIKETTNKEGENKKMFSILELTNKGFNTYYLTTKDENIEKQLEKNIGKSVICFGHKNGNFISIAADKKLAFGEVDLEKEFFEIGEMLENVRVLRVVKDEKTNILSLAVMTSTNQGLTIKIKDSEKIDGKIIPLNKNMILDYVSIFRSKEGKAFYSITNNLKKHIILSKETNEK